MNINYYKIGAEIERGNAVSETVGKLAKVNADLDALLTQMERLLQVFEGLNEGLSYVKRAYGR